MSWLDEDGEDFEIDGEEEEKERDLVANVEMKSWKEMLSPRDYWLRSELFYYDSVKNYIWYYRDRTGMPRGPCTLNILKTAWVNGIVDEHTLVWGNGLGSWVPIRNVRGLGAHMNDPFTRLYKFMLRKLMDTDEKKRAVRAAHFQAGRANRDTLYGEEVTQWKQQREKWLWDKPEDEQGSGTMGGATGNAIASLSLAIPLKHLRPKEK